MVIRKINAAADLARSQRNELFVKKKLGGADVAAGSKISSTTDLGRSQSNGLVVKKKLGGADVAPVCIQDRFCLALDRWIWRMQLQRRRQWSEFPEVCLGVLL